MCNSLIFNQYMVMKPLAESLKLSLLMSCIYLKGYFIIAVNTWLIYERLNLRSWGDFQ